MYAAECGRTLLEKKICSKYISGQPHIAEILADITDKEYPSVNKREDNTHQHRRFQTTKVINRDRLHRKLWRIST